MMLYVNIRLCGKERKNLPMKMRRTWMLVAAIVMSMSLALGGTLAYLSDTDSAVNVMTLGNVNIKQLEYQRAPGVPYNEGEPGAGNGIKKIENKLVPFKQGQALYPAVPVNNQSTDYSAAMDSADLFFWGEYVSTGTAGNGLFDDAKLKNVMDKFVFVENTGKSDAYVRTIFAFELPDGMTFDGNTPYNEAKSELYINSNNGTWSWDTIGYFTINGVRYLVESATYNRILEQGNTSHPSLLQVVLTHNATNEDMELLGDTYEILTLSQAVQAQGFNDAATALNTAFGEVTEANVKEWFGDITPVTSVATADELAAAIANGGTIVLTDNIELTGKEGISIPTGTKVTLDLGGKKITGAATTEAGHNVLIANNGELTIEGEGEIAVTFNGAENNSVAVNAISNRGKLTVNGGKISNTANGGSQIGYAIDCYNGSSLVINGGEMTSSGSSYYDAVRLFCGNKETVVTVNGGTISSIWAQNPSANKATEVKGTVIINGGDVSNTYFENYTTVEVKDGVTATVTPYGAGKDNTTSVNENGYTVYSFVH